MSRNAALGVSRWTAAVLRDHATFVDARQLKSQSGLCQNCVTYPLKPRVKTVIYEDMSTRIDVGSSR